MVLGCETGSSLWMPGRRNSGKRPRDITNPARRPAQNARTTVVIHKFRSAGIISVHLFS
jgi:DNA-binding cell septation regulator SpoVG